MCMPGILVLFQFDLLAIFNLMTIPIVHHPAYCAELPANHRFPMDKFRAVAELIRSEGLLAGKGFVRPRPAPAQWVALAHDRLYVDQVFSANVPDRIAREIGFPMKEDIALRARCATGGTVLSGYLALENGLACNTAGGSHHARRKQGAGFCVFNDVAVAIRVMQADGAIRKALVVDLDVHQGDGTADIFAGDDSVFTFSMHAEKNYPVRKILSDLDIALPDETGDTEYLSKLKRMLAVVVDRAQPDIVFYNAGVDPFGGDKLGRLNLSREGLRLRDRFVLELLRARQLPIACVLGGGYTTNIAELADRHVTLHREAVLAADRERTTQSVPGDCIRNI